MKLPGNPTRKQNIVSLSSKLMVAWLGLVLFTCGCTANTASASGLEPVNEPVPTATTTNTPTIEPTEAVLEPTLEPTLEKCTQKHGRLEDFEVPNSSLSYPLKIRVYFPPCYTAEPEKPYPYMIMIHGMLYKNDQWDRLGIDETADKLISSGEADPFLIIMPFEEQSTGNPYEDGFGEALTNGLIPWMEENYPVCAERSCRAIGGLSRGAGWAVHIGLSQPQYFGSIGAHSLPPFIGDLASAPRWLAKIEKRDMPSVYIDIGIVDSGMAPASQFEGILTAYDVPHEWYINNGEHTEDYWSSHVEDYLRWYAAGWQNGEPPVILD